MMGREVREQMVPTPEAFLEGCEGVRQLLHGFKRGLSAEVSDLRLHFCAHLRELGQRIRQAARLHKQSQALINYPCKAPVSPLFSLAVVCNNF